MKPSPSPSKSFRAGQRPWEAVATAVVVLLLICTELLPVVFGTGMRAMWDWSSLYIALRFTVIPSLAIVVSLAALARLPWSRGRAAWIRVGVVLTCAAVVLASWVYRLPVLGR